MFRLSSIPRRWGSGGDRSAFWARAALDRIARFLGRSTLALFTPEGHKDRVGGFQPVTFWCDDVFATAALLKSKGVELAAEPRKKSGERWRNSRTPTETNLCFRAGKGSNADIGLSSQQLLFAAWRYQSLEPQIERERGVLLVIVGTLPHNIPRRERLTGPAWIMSLILASVSEA